MHDFKLGWLDLFSGLCGRLLDWHLHHSDVSCEAIVKAGLTGQNQIKYIVFQVRVVYNNECPAAAENRRHIGLCAECSHSVQRSHWRAVEWKKPNNKRLGLKEGCDLSLSSYSLAISLPLLPSSPLRPSPPFLPSDWHFCNDTVWAPRALPPSHP